MAARIVKKGKINRTKMCLVKFKKKKKNLTLKNP